MLHQTEHPRPERLAVGARHADVDIAVVTGHSGDDAIGAELTRDGRGPRGVDAHDRLRRGAVGTERLRVVRQHGAQVEALRALERVASTHLDPPIDAVDAERPALATRAVERDEVPEPVAQQQPVRFDSAIDVAVQEVDRRPSVDRLAQHRQAGQRRHRRHHRRLAVDHARAELPHRLLAELRARAASRRPPPAAPASRRARGAGRRARSGRGRSSTWSSRRTAHRRRPPARSARRARVARPCRVRTHPAEQLPSPDTDPATRRRSRRG